MSSLPATVADFYRYVVGIDTHAATHSYAIITPSSGGLLDQATFPTPPRGCDEHATGSLAGLTVTSMVCWSPRKALVPTGLSWPTCSSKVAIEWSRGPRRTVSGVGGRPMPSMPSWQPGPRW